jgi:N-acetylglutamate synthase-like GNAT family acetyltransferase
MVMNNVASDAFLARQTEETFDNYSFAWEGEAEHVEDGDDVRLIHLPERWSGLDGVVARMKLSPDGIDKRLDALLAAVGDRNYWWAIGPSSTPPDLAERLTARGLRATIQWDCLGLSDLSAEFPVNPDVRVEALSPQNAADYAGLMAATEPEPALRAQVRADKLAAAQRYLARPQRDAHIFLGRLDGVAASCVVLRIEPNGVAYLRNAETLPRYRNRGLYLTLVNHRLKVAKEAGCTSAVVQAQIQSSSPILQKRGFRRVSWLRALTRPATP